VARHGVCFPAAQHNHWVGLPAIPAAQHNHYRFQFTAGMFVSGGMFHPLVEFLSLAGYFHTIVSRGANSRFAEVVVGQIFHHDE